MHARVLLNGDDVTTGGVPAQQPDHTLKQTDQTDHNINRHINSSTLREYGAREAGRGKGRGKGPRTCRPM